MAGKSIHERIADADLRIRQLEARKQLLAQRLKEKERKARTRRLIQIGAILSNMGMDTVEKAQIFQRVVAEQPRAREWLRRVLELASAPQEADEEPEA